MMMFILGFLTAVFIEGVTLLLFRDRWQDVLDRLP